MSERVATGEDTTRNTRLLLGILGGGATIGTAAGVAMWQVQRSHVMHAAESVTTSGIDLLEINTPEGQNLPLRRLGAAVLLNPSGAQSKVLHKMVKMGKRELFPLGSSLYLLSQKGLLQRSAHTDEIEPTQGFLDEAVLRAEELPNLLSQMSTFYGWLHPGQSSSVADVVETLLPYISDEARGAFFAGS